MKKSYVIALAVACVAMACVLVGYTASKKPAPAPAEAVVVTGEADGFGGPITAEVTLLEGKIIDLTLTGEKETADYGGKAIPELKESILAAGTIEGVDGVSGATWTSNGVFAAIRNAIGAAEQAPEGGEEAGEATAAGLTHGLGIVSTGRVGPGKDDTGTQVYSFNEVAAYVVFDENGVILELEVDQLEVATPNYDGEYMPDFTGFPGQSYNADADHDEKVDAEWTQDDETYLAQVAAWRTKRERGNTYKLNSATWEAEMDLFEQTFRGMTVAEVQAWFDAYCSDVNGRPLHGTSTNDADVAKYEALSDADKAMLDGIAGATMSLKDGHGDIISAIVKAYENRREMPAVSVAKIGLGVTSSGRVGPGKDDTDTQVYSFNTQYVGACYDAEGKIVALYTDVMEVATPNYDGEYMPDFTGFPGQSYNADADHDEKVDAEWVQDDETFLAQVAAWRTKRERGTTYKLNSGTWTDEMNIFEGFFAGMTDSEVQAWFDAYCSDVNGRPLHGTSTNDADVAKYEALSDADKTMLDGIAGATMSLKDGHGDIMAAIHQAWQLAKAAAITVG